MDYETKQMLLALIRGLTTNEGGNQYCTEGAFIFGDCGLNQNPDSEELAYIAISSAESARLIVGMEPRVAFLSHSSKDREEGESR